MSTSGGSVWNRINGDSIKYGYVVSAGAALYQVGEWWDERSKPHIAIVRSTSDTGPWKRYIVTMDSSKAHAFAVNPASPNVLYVGGCVGTDTSQWSTHYACLYKSTDSGVNWTRLAGSVFTTSPECVYGLCVDPFNANLVIAVTDRGPYRSTNAGSAWTASAQAFGGKCVVPDPTVSGRFFAGGKDGVYESTDGGVNWTKISKGLTAKTITSLSYDATAQRLVAGSYGAGMYRLSFIPTGVTGPDEVPERIVLEQNYPNPFNPVTTIGYAIPGAGGQGLGMSDVKLAVYDLLGREMATLVNERKEPGVHSVKFDAGALASGVYLYRLTAGTTVLTRRMLLVR